jgi:hypothetical protein
MLTKFVRGWENLVKFPLSNLKKIRSQNLMLLDVDIQADRNGKATRYKRATKI